MVNDHLRQLVTSRRLALWVSADCSESDVRSALDLPWTIIWSAANPETWTAIDQDAKGNKYRLIRNSAELPPTSAPTPGITFVYDVSIPKAFDPSAILRNRRRAEALENEIEGWSSLLVYVGLASPSKGWLEVIAALAPDANILHAHSLASSKTVEWPDGLESFYSAASEILRELERGDVLDLKDATGVAIQKNGIEVLQDSWELLTRQYTNAPAGVPQAAFDAFLSGGRGWAAMSADVAYNRGPICGFQDRLPNAPSRMHDPIEYARDAIKALDRADTDPFNSVAQLQLFAERGSGCTTLLQQIALAIARDGYPTLITKPYPRELGLAALQNLIVNIQDAWAKARSGRGSGSGALPVCLVLDVDAELPAHFASLIRALFSDLNRKLLIVQAVRRSGDEIEFAKGVLRLTAQTSENEILALGDHLKLFCARHGLQDIPSEDEWRTFYQSFGKVTLGHRTTERVEMETPPLFLVGLYPFVKERVRDEHSLERYLYNRWREIKDPAGRKLVEVLAAAGAHGIAVPFETLMRNASLDNALFDRLSDQDQQLMDFFFRWRELGWRKQDWALYIRHAAFGILLMRMIRPVEAEAPYSPLLPLLSEMVGSEADRWFAEQIAYVLGQQFYRASAAFTLDVDTNIQRAGRELFDALPASIRSESRLICHHHARYYIHLLHACVDALREPSRTALSAYSVEQIALASMKQATILLEQARSIQDGREKLSNVINTLAASISQLAQSYAVRGNDDQARQYFADAIQQAGEAVSADAGNGFALFNQVNTILRNFEAGLVDTPHQAADLFEISEDRLDSLVEIYQRRRWRNSTDEDAEISILDLLQRQQRVAEMLGTNPRVQFTATSPAATIVLQIRRTLGATTLQAAFHDAALAAQLRIMRADLLELKVRTPRTAQLLYKLFLNDAIGRLDFDKRLELLTEIERDAPEDYDAYRHDRAALLFQAGAVEAGDRVFQQIYAARSAEPERWFWMNERLLIDVRDGVAHPKHCVVRVTDPIQGWARLSDTKVRVKIQPRQFSGARRDEYLSVFIRFRLTGLQAIDERMARHDLAAMGLTAENRSV